MAEPPVRASEKSVVCSAPVPFDALNTGSLIVTTALILSSDSVVETIVGGVFSRKDNTLLLCEAFATFSLPSKTASLAKSIVSFSLPSAKPLIPIVSLYPVSVFMIEVGFLLASVAVPPESESSKSVFSSGRAPVLDLKVVSLNSTSAVKLSGLSCVLMIFGLVVSILSISNTFR